MKKKSLRIILSLAICVMVMTMFSVTAFAAGDVSGAIASTSAAGVFHGTTVISQPTRASPSRIERLIPQS